MRDSEIFWDNAGPVEKTGHSFILRTVGYFALGVMCVVSFAVSFAAVSFLF